jgi:hypothetical protein
MENITETELMVKEIREWCLERHSKLIRSDRVEDAIALDSEFYEWLSISEDDKEPTIEILSITTTNGPTP